VATKCPKCHSDNPETVKFCGECGTRLDLPQTPQVSVTRTLETTADELTRGIVFAGRYEVIEELGHGGMGRVYRAHDTKLNEEVALKLIRPEIAAEKRVVERFRNEIKIARKIRHKNVCGMYDFHEEGKTLYLTMEYVRGEDLKSLIHRTKALTIGTAISIAQQVAEGLREAHGLGVVHRDLKPGNIMIDRDGNAKIMDFGIARVRQERGVTGEGVLIGTPEYMSPEQVEGKPADPRSDIYSLGIILFEMVVGCPPFEGETPFSVANKHKTESPPIPKKLVPQIPEGLSRLILRCLEKDKATRYQKTEDLLGDLQAVEATLPATERTPTGTPSRTKPKISREITVKITPRKLVIPAAALLVLIVVVVGLIKLLPRADALDSIAILPIVNISGDPDQETLALGLTEALISEFYKVRSLQVTSRQAVMPYRNSDTPPQRIAQELRVKALVEASVQRSGHRIRLTARLFDPFRNRIVWDGTLDREYEDILFLQSELCRTIVDEIKVAVTPAEQALLAQARKVNPEAYDLFLQGVSWMRRADIPPDEAESRAIDSLAKAISIDPEFASAHAWLGYEYWSQGINFERNEREVYPKAKASLTKALEMDPTFGVAHAHMGWVKCTVDWDFAGAEESFKRAMELLPGDPDIRFSYGVYLAQIVGRFDEGIALHQSLREEPSLQLYWGSKLVMYLLDAKRYDEALETARNAVAGNETNVQALMMLAEAYASNGMHSEALSVSNKVMGFPGMQDEPAFLVQAARIEALAGRRDEALGSMERLKVALRAKDIDDSFSLAIIHTALGDKEEALKHLTDAYDERSGQMIFIKYSWWFPSLQGDPRFEELEKKIGFPVVPRPKKAR